MGLLGQISALWRARGVVREPMNMQADNERNDDMRRHVAILCLLAAPGCFLFGDPADTATDTAGGTGGEGGDIPSGYPTYFIGESRTYHLAPMACQGPEITISPGMRLADLLSVLEDSLKEIIFGDGYDWLGVLHCDPAADASCNNVEHKISDWTDAQASSSAPTQRRDDMFADSATLSVFFGHGQLNGENLIFPESMPTPLGGNSCQLWFAAEDARLNAGSIGSQGANGLVLASPCHGHAGIWGTPPSADIKQTSDPNRIFAFGGSAVMLAEDSLAVWWANLFIEDGGFYGISVVEEWHYWHTQLNQQGNVYSNLPVVITFRNQSETYAQFEDRASLCNIRSGHYYEPNETPKHGDFILDWFVYDAPTACGF